MLTPEQLEERRNAVSGSAAAAACGVSERTTMFAQWEWHTRRCEIEVTPEMLRRFRIGHLAEPMCDAMFREDTGKTTRKVNRTLRHPKHAWMIANIDRDVVGEDAGLELKTASQFMASDWGEPGSAEVPTDYLLQCYHYMAVTGCKRWYLAPLIGGVDFRVYVIERDENKINDLIDAERTYWGFVQRDEAPPPATEDDCNRRWCKDNGETKDATPEIAHAVDQIMQIKRAVKDAEQEIETLGVAVREFMGNAQVLRWNDQKIVTWKNQSAERLDVKALRASLPDVAAQFVKSSDSRVFRPKEVTL